jgi:hypothetical protein
MDNGRRDFVRLMVIAGVGTAVGGCGNDTKVSCTDFGGTAASITGNHGHILSVPAADFSSGTSHSYSIMGSAAHDHEITLTSQQLTDIAAGMSVEVQSSESAVPSVHSHAVTVTCASGSSGGGY